MILFRTITVFFNSKRSRACRGWLLLILLVALRVEASAGIRPSFMPDDSSWQATHIVMVEATAEDGVFQVIESWKGDLQPGERITISELKPGPDAFPISMYPAEPPYLSPNDTSTSTQIPKQIPGLRLVLFLKSGDRAQPSLRSSEQRKTPQWQPSNLFHDMKTAAVWIDGEKLNSFAQIMNPGPSVLVTLSRYDWDAKKNKWNVTDMTTADLRARVDRVVQIQQELTTAIHIADMNARAEKLKTYVLSDVGPAQSLAFGELAKAGPAALPVLRAMLDNPEYSKLKEGVIHAYVQAGGAALGEELSERLKSELAFWKVTGPSLARGWWNQDATPDAPLRQRYSVTLEIVRALGDSRPSSALNAVIELRDLWRSLSQLNDPSGVDQMADECDALIRHLQSEQDPREKLR